MEEVNENANSETSEEVVEEQSDQQEATLTAEQITELREKAAKADDLEGKNKQLFERVKKAEAAKAEAKPAENINNLSAKDFLALTQAGVTAEDFDEVERVAKILGKPLTDALQDKTLKSILKERADERKTAEATHTRGGARGTSKTADADILAKAERGEMVDSEEGMQAIFKARIAKKLGSDKR